MSRPFPLQFGLAFHIIRPMAHPNTVNSLAFQLFQATIVLHLVCSLKLTAIRLKQQGNSSILRYRLIMCNFHSSHLALATNGRPLVPLPRTLMSL